MGWRRWRSPASNTRSHVSDPRVLLRWRSGTVRQKRLIEIHLIRVYYVKAHQLLPGVDIVSEIPKVVQHA